MLADGHHEGEDDDWLRTGDVGTLDHLGYITLTDGAKDVIKSGVSIVDRATGCLLGATLVGPEAGELLHAATIAIVGRVPVHLLRHAVLAFPTASGLWLRLLEQLPGELRRT